jgi:predicted nucleic acid-binding protein
MWADIRARCRSAGRPISPQDAWIAASALQYALPLVTHNTADFEAVETLDIITTVKRDKQQETPREENNDTPTQT